MKKFLGTAVLLLLLILAAGRMTGWHQTHALVRAMTRSARPTSPSQATAPGGPESAASSHPDPDASENPPPQAPPNANQICHTVRDLAWQLHFHVTEDRRVSQNIANARYPNLDRLCRALLDRPLCHGSEACTLSNGMQITVTTLDNVVDEVEIRCNSRDDTTAAAIQSGLVNAYPGLPCGIRHR